VKVKCLIGLLLVSINLTSVEAYSGNLASQNSIQDATWVLNIDSGIPFSIALNVVKREFLPSRRSVFIFVEPQYCTKENFRRIFLYLSEKYLQPAQLMIEVRSDKASLQRWADNYLAFNSMRPDGSFERRKNRLSHMPLETEKGFYQAHYFRLEGSEQFSYSQDPNKQDFVSVTLERRVGVDSKGEWTFLPSGDMNLDLVLALQLSLEDRIKELLNNGADVNGRTRHGTSPLLTAIQRRDSKIVNLLLERGADVNQKDPDGWTPLMYALDFKGNMEIAEELLRRNAEVNARAANGDTALIIAVARSQGLTRMVEQLLCRRADVNVRDKFGRTPLMIAEEQDHMDYILDMLKQAGNEQK
jgi:hypothetical protein